LLVELHTHTIFSDGCLIASELVRRYEAVGYAGVAITDHADMTNFDFLIERNLRAAEALSRFTAVKVVAGVELTHVPPALIESLVRECRDAGAQLVLVHGETIVEPVAPGTNRAAIEAGADVLAHPGLIAEEDVKLAAAKGVRLEVTGRKGHSLTNAHVAAAGRKFGAKLTYGTDCHAPSDINSEAELSAVLAGAGLSEDEIAAVMRNGCELLGLSEEGG